MRIRSFVRPTLAAVLGMYVCAGSVHSYASSHGKRVSGVGIFAGKSEGADAHILGVVAITKVFADGLKVSAVAIQYDKNIRDASLKAADFEVTTSVAGQKITDVYTSTDGLNSTKRGLNGPYVILELSTDYVIPVPVHKVASAEHSGPPPANSRPEPEKQEVTLNPEVETQVGNISWDPTAHPATLKSSKHGGDGEAVSVNQVGPIEATDGTTFTATSAARDNVYCRNLIVDGFMKPAFITDGNPTKYNIHFPPDYDPGKKYPVVVFLDDSDSPEGYRHAEYLIRGLGGVIWASKEDEARHPAIVVVPALGRALVNDSYEPAIVTRPGGKTFNPYLSILEVIEGLSEKIPSIDPGRFYVTGQGDGARAAIRMMEDRPNLFTAALLFAPDYDPSKIAPLAKAKMWIVVSEGDTACYSSMQAAIATLKSSGARVGEAVWNGQDDAAQLASDVRRMTAKGNSIEYTVLKKGTVVPFGVSDDEADNHAYTWRIGYSIQPLRDWLFTQTKAPESASR